MKLLAILLLVLISGCSVKNTDEQTFDLCEFVKIEQIGNENGYGEINYLVNYKAISNYTGKEINENNSDVVVSSTSGLSNGDVFEIELKNKNAKFSKCSKTISGLKERRYIKEEADFDETVYEMLINAVNEVIINEYTNDVDEITVLDLNNELFGIFLSEDNDGNITIWVATNHLTTFENGIINSGNQLDGFVNVNVENGDSISFESRKYGGAIWVDHTGVFQQQTPEQTLDNEVAYGREIKWKRLR